MPDDDKIDFWAELQKDPQFDSLSYVDKVAYAQWWAQQQAMDLPEETASALTADVIGAIAERKKSQLAEEVPEKATFLSEVAKDVTEPVKAEVAGLGAIAKRVAEQPIGQTAADVGWTVADSFAHVLSLLPRTALSLEQLPLSLINVPIQLTGKNALSTWMNSYVASFDETKKQYDVLKTPMSQVEEAVVMAGLTGAGAGSLFRSISGAGRNFIMQLPGFTATDAAIASAASAMAGEAVVVQPVAAIVNNSLDTSTFNENTKKVLRLVMPILIGVVSGATVEARVDKILNNPSLVNEIISRVSKGEAPEDVAEEVSRVAKAPNLYEETAAKTAGAADPKRAASPGAPEPPKPEPPKPEPPEQILPQDAVQEVERVLEPEAITIIGPRGERTPYKQPEPPGFEIVEERAPELAVEEVPVVEPKPSPAPPTPKPVVLPPEPEVLPTAGSTEKALADAWIDRLSAADEAAKADAAMRAEQQVYEDGVTRTLQRQKARKPVTAAEEVPPGQSPEELLMQTAQERRAARQQGLAEQAKVAPPEDLTDPSGLAATIDKALPAARRARKLKIKKTETSATLSFDEFMASHGEIMNVLAKYRDPEELLKYATIPKNASELSHIQTGNLLTLAYDIPSGRPWTTEVFDDLLTACRSAEALHARMTSGIETATKKELLDRLDGQLRDEIGSDAEFVKQMVKVLKQDDKIFKLLPVRPSNPGINGYYDIVNNTLAFRDSFAIPHEMGHWAFMNALSGADRLQYLEILRERVASGWTPGENLAMPKAVTFPDGGVSLRTNAEDNPNEYFAEQFAQYFYTRRANGNFLFEMALRAEKWTGKALKFLKNENLLDSALEPFFKRFAEVDQLERLHHPEMSGVIEQANLVTEALVSARALGQKLGGGKALLSGEGFQQVTQDFIGKLREFAANGDMTQEDFVRLSSLNTKGFQQLLLEPKTSNVLRTMRDLGLTGQHNTSLIDMTLRFLHDERGAVDPSMLNKIALHAVPLLAGFEERDGELSYNVERALKVTGAFYGLVYGGKGFRALGIPGKILGTQKTLTEKFFNFMTEPAEGGLSKVRQLTGDVLTMFRPTEGIDPELWGLGRQFKGKWHQAAQQLDAFTQHLNKHFTPEEREMISQVIEREGDNWPQASDAVVAQAAEVQKLLAGIREQLAASGVDPAVLSKHGDQWLHRVYTPKATANPRQFVRQRMRSMQQSYLKGRGQTVKMRNPTKQFGLDIGGFAPAELGYSWLDNLGRRRWALESQTERVAQLDAKYGQNGRTEWTIERGKRGVTAKRDYTKLEREQMGEVQDVAVRLADFFREASHDITLGHTFQQMERTHSVKPPEGLDQNGLKVWAEDNDLVKMPNTFSTKGIARYGALNGKYVQPDVQRVLERLTSSRYESELGAAVGGAWKKLHSLWKTGVTALNPGAHLTNFITNNFMLFADGRNPATIFYNGIEAVAKKTQHYREAIEAGWNPHTLGEAEFDLGTFAKTVPTKDAMLPRLLSGFVKAAKFPVKSAVQMYSLSDDVVKLGIFTEERLAGRTPKEALDAATRIIPDYSDLPRGVQFLRDSAIMPFVSWTYKVLPTMARSMVNRPELYIGLAVAAKAINDHSYEKQFGERAEAERQLETELQTKEKKDSGLFGLGPSGRIRLQSEGDVARFLDVRKYIPGSDLFEQTVDAFPFGMSPVLSTMYGLASGKQAFNDRPFIPHDDPKTPIEEEQNLDATLQFLANTWLPKIPGMPLTWSTDKVGNALVATGAISEGSVLWDVAQRRGWTGKDYFGNNVSILDTALQLGGVPLGRLDVGSTAQVRTAQAVKRIREAPKILTKAALEAASTPARREAAREQYTQQVQQSSEELRRLRELLEATGR